MEQRNTGDSSEKKREKCPYCHRVFVSQDELTLHIVTRHTHKGKTGSLAQTGVKR